ncbi:XylR N-terminal domain-containing protein [Niallia sp. XMNu-256]|uniref:XylR N-terminal domain-containing protein n=1 Tax=Niallia sp. XMNu-256 TaxID=3082444 RepID=UPI0030CC0399
MKIQDVVADNSKKLLSTTDAFGVLRSGLIRNLGKRRATGFLLRYGWNLGVNDATEAMKISSSLNDLIDQASTFHLNTGFISDIESERHTEIDDSGKVTYIRATGKWKNSIEAREHVKHLGQSDTLECLTLTGYATGYMTTVCQRPVFAKEISCIAKGDPECCFEVRLQEDWGKEVQDHLKMYHEMNIIEELEGTYEQLLEQRNYVEKLSTFQKKLTDSISNGSNLQDIADTTYKFLQIPIAIEDLGFQKIVIAGITEEEYFELNTEMVEHCTRENKHLLPDYDQTTKLVSGNQVRLITPITVQKKIIGYCTFIYHNDEVNYTDNDMMFIERVANAASLNLLNEKVSYEALERMKGDFLQLILRGEFNSKEEIIKRGSFMGYDFRSPYRIAAIEYVKKGAKTQKKDFKLQLLETITKYMDIQGYKALFCTYEGRVIFYIPSVGSHTVDLGKILKHIESTNPSYSFKIGVSDESDDIGNISEYVDECLISLRMSTDKKMIHFSELGIVGVLINSKNINGIKRMVKQELGPLYQSNDAKTKELIKTLYVFLKNGGKLHKTMEDLALSMSGLTYRINKLESLLEKDLRDSSQSYQLLLILDSMIAMGELKI